MLNGTVQTVVKNFQPKYEIVAVMEIVIVHIVMEENLFRESIP